MTFLKIKKVINRRSFFSFLQCNNMECWEQTVATRKFSKEMERLEEFSQRDHSVACVFYECVTCWYEWELWCLCSVMSCVLKTCPDVYGWDSENLVDREHEVGIRLCCIWLCGLWLNYCWTPAILTHGTRFWKTPKTASSNHCIVFHQTYFFCSMW